MKNVMDKFGLFLENFFIFGLGSVISKVIPFIMLPIITRLMPDTEYFGINSLVQVATSLGTSLGVLGLYDAMYRLFFEYDDNEAYRVSVCSTALFFSLVNSFVVFLVLILFRNQFALIIFNNENYVYLVDLIAATCLVGATNTIVAAPTRMQNERKVFLIMNTLGPIVSYSCSILLLLKGYFIIALPVAALASSMILEVTFWCLNRKWFKPASFSRKILKDLLKIALPIVPVFICYWLLNSVNNVLLAKLTSMAEVGIYSVGSKLGQASQLIYLAFAGGWQYFAFATMKDDQQVKNNSLVFEYLGAISFMATMITCACSYDLYNTLFTGDYIKGYLIAPYLFLAPLILMLYQVIGNQFLVVKKTWPCAFLVLAGALVNIGLNRWLIPLVGIEGAALGSVFGYTVTVILAAIMLCKMNLLVISKRFYTSVAVLVSYMFIWRLYMSQNVVISFPLALFGISIISYIYKNELKFLVSNIIKLVKNRKIV